MTARGTLRNCPECFRPWPRGADFDLRSFRWLDNLPRFVSPSNIDCVIHDGGNGRSRFLVLETKRDGEGMDNGQAWLLRALAGISTERVTVRLLVGTVEALHVHRVTGAEVEPTYYTTTAGLFRGAVAAFLDGALWRDAEAPLRTVDVPVARPQPHAFGPCSAPAPEGSDVCFEPVGHVGPHKTKSLSFVWPVAA